MLPDWALPLLTFGGPMLLAGGGALGAILTHSVARRKAKTEAFAAEAAAKTAAFAAQTVAENSLVGQLQSELSRYREQTDGRLKKLELENTAYRDYVFALIDHANTNGITPLPWPNNLPR